MKLSLIMKPMYDLLWMPCTFHSPKSTVLVVFVFYKRRTLLFLLYRPKTASGKGRELLAIEDIELQSRIALRRTGEDVELVQISQKSLRVSNCLELT